MGKQYLSNQMLNEMRRKAIDVLCHVGIQFKNEKVLDTFRKHGAKVDHSIVFFTEKLLEDSLSTLSAETNKECSVNVSGRLFDGISVIYEESVQLFRAAEINDVVKMYCLSQTSDIYDAVGVNIANPIGLNGKNSFLAQWALLLKYCDKPISTGFRPSASNAAHGNVYETAKSAYHMVRLLNDIWDRPLVTQTLSPYSPLTYDAECLDTFLANVEEQQAICICPSSLTNFTGPCTLTGIVINDMALSLAGVALCQLLSPGFPVSVLPCTVPADMRTCQPLYGSPEFVLTSVMEYELTRSFGIAASVYGGVADSPYPNYQAGVESMLTALAPFLMTELSGIYCCTGVLASLYCGSFYKAIYDEEMIRYVRRLLKGVSGTIEEDLLNNMKQVGHSGLYIMGKTPTSYRQDHYMTKIFNKKGIMDSQNVYQSDIREKAQKEIESRLASYQLPTRTNEQMCLLNQYLPEGYRFSP